MVTIFVGLFSGFLGALAMFFIQNFLYEPRRAKNLRRHEIFSELMLCRVLMGTGQHVKALVACQIEFMKDTPVMNAYISYINKTKEPDGGKQLFELYINIIKAVAKEIKIDLDEHHLTNLAYLPDALIQQLNFGTAANPQYVCIIPHSTTGTTSTTSGT